MNKYWFYKVGLVVVFLCFALAGGAKVKQPALVSDGMVLQRGKQVNLWGTAASDETVNVAFLKKKYKTVVDTNANITLITNSGLDEWNDIHSLDKKTLGQQLSQAVFQQRSN